MNLRQPTLVFSKYFFVFSFLIFFFVFTQFYQMNCPSNLALSKAHVLLF